MDTRAERRLYCHTVDATNVFEEASTLEDLLAVKFEVFSEWSDHQDAPSDDLAKWKTEMRNPTAIMAYASQSPTPDPSSALGVFFAVPKTQPEIGYELLHLSQAAVKVASRGLGAFPLLMGRIQQHARDCGYKEMTVCTFPDRFVKMYRILQQHGWKEVARRENGVKVLMKISLD